MARSLQLTVGGLQRRTASLSGNRVVVFGDNGPAVPIVTTPEISIPAAQRRAALESNAYEDSHCGSRSGTVRSMNTTDASAIKTAQLVAMRAWNADRVARLKGVASHEADLSTAFEAARVSELAAIANRAK